MKATSAILPLLAAVSVAAHGYLSVLTINDKDYTGNNPYNGNNPSVIRKITSPDPNYGTSNPALTCGPGASAGSEVADANPGDIFLFDWRGADGSHWPHNTGPMLTYMASCGSTACDQFDTSQAKWFKIYQVGRKAGSVQWVQQDLYNGGVDTVSLPDNLAPGNYLVRHEIIALHLATSRGGAEFYPSCVQVRVGGTKTGKPTDDELVSFPGGYSDDDPGIFDPEIYNTNVDYVFPGPPVAVFVGGNSSSGGVVTPPKSTPAPQFPVKAVGKVCKLKPKPVFLDSNDRHSHLTRLIRRLTFRWTS